MEREGGSRQKELRLLCPPRPATSQPATPAHRGRGPPDGRPKLRAAQQAQHGQAVRVLQVHSVGRLPPILEVLEVGQKGGVVKVAVLGQPWGGATGVWDGRVGAQWAGGRAGGRACAGRPHCRHRARTRLNPQPPPSGAAPVGPGVREGAARPHGAHRQGTVGGGGCNSTHTGPGGRRAPGLDDLAHTLTLKSHPRLSQVSCVDCSPTDAARALSAGADRCVKLWDLARGESQGC